MEWYDELLALGDSPVIRLNRAVAIGEADGPHAGLAALAGIPDDVPRIYAAHAYLHERTGERDAAAAEYAEAARRATSNVEQEYLVRRAERLRAVPERHGTGDGQCGGSGERSERNAARTG